MLESFVRSWVHCHLIQLSSFVGFFLLSFIQKWTKRNFVTNWYQFQNKLLEIHIFVKARQKNLKYMEGGRTVQKDTRGHGCFWIFLISARHSHGDLWPTMFCFRGNEASRLLLLYWFLNISQRKNWMAKRTNNTWTLKKKTFGFFFLFWFFWSKN